MEGGGGARTGEGALEGFRCSSAHACWLPWLLGPTAADVPSAAPVRPMPASRPPPPPPASRRARAVRGSWFSRTLSPHPNPPRAILRRAPGAQLVLGFVPSRRPSLLRCMFACGSGVQGVGAWLMFACGSGCLHVGAVHVCMLMRSCLYVGRGWRVLGFVPRHAGRSPTPWLCARRGLPTASRPALSARLARAMALHSGGRAAAQRGARRRAGIPAGGGAAA